MQENAGASPQKRKYNGGGNGSDRCVLDLILGDETGVVFATLWDEVAVSFVEQLNAMQASSGYAQEDLVIVSLNNIQVNAIPNNDWNGPCLTSMRNLGSLGAIGGRP